VGKEQPEKNRGSPEGFVKAKSLMYMFWKIALATTVLYYTALVVLDKRSQQTYKLKEATARAIGKTGINTEAGIEEGTIVEDVHPNLFGSTANHEQVADISPVVKEPEQENLIPNPDTAPTEALPEIPTQKPQAEPEETLPESITQNPETVPAEISTETQEPKLQPSTAIEASETPTEVPVEKSTTQVLKGRESDPKTDDEAKRNFLFAGTSLAADATPQTLEEVVVDKALEEDLESLASEVLIFEEPVPKT